jgi:hypothetical protein
MLVLSLARFRMIYSEKPAPSRCIRVSPASGSPSLIQTPHSHRLCSFATASTKRYIYNALQNAIQKEKREKNSSDPATHDTFIIREH